LSKKFGGLRLVPKSGLSAELLGTRPTSMKCLEISVAAFLGQSVKEVRPPATCAEKRLVGRTSEPPSRLPGRDRLLIEGCQELPSQLGAHLFDQLRVPRRSKEACNLH